MQGVGIGFGLCAVILFYQRTDLTDSGRANFTRFVVLGTSKNLNGMGVWGKGHDQL